MVKSVFLRDIAPSTREEAFDLTNECTDISELQQGIMNLLKLLSDSRGFDAEQRQAIRAIYYHAEEVQQNMAAFDRRLTELLRLFHIDEKPSPARDLQERAEHAMGG